MRVITDPQPLLCHNITLLAKGTHEMKRLLALAIGCTTLVLAGTGTSAAERVVASIKPVHALVAGIMQGVGEPDLLMTGGGSPHTYSLRPSQARALQGAGLVFWVGPDLEAFLEKPVGTLAKEATVVTLLEAPGLTTLALREGGYAVEVALGNGLKPLEVGLEHHGVARLAQRVDEIPGEHE